MDASNESTSSSSFGEKSKLVTSVECVSGKYDSTKGDLDSKAEEGNAESKSGILGASFNLSNATVANGLIATPFALAKCGVLLGIALLIAVAIVADYALRIIIKAGNYVNAYSYQDLMYSAFGTPGFCVITFMQFCFSYLSLVSYLVLIGDTVAALIAGFTDGLPLGDFGLPGWSWSTLLGDHRFIIFLVAVAVIFPLSLVRNVAIYSKISAVSLLAVLTMAVITVYELVVFTQDSIIPPTPNDWYLFSGEFANGVSIIAIMYTCHHMSFVMYDSLLKRTEKTWAKVVHISMGAILVIILLFSICGYATFRKYTQADLSENLCISDVAGYPFRISLTMVLMFIYPLDCLVVKQVLENTIFRNCQPQPCWRNVIIVMAIVSSTGAIAMFTPCVDIVLEINGIVNALPVVFVLPPLCLIRLRPEPFLSRKNVVPILTVVLGSVFFAFGVYRIALHFMHGVECQSPESLPYCNTQNATSSMHINLTNGVLV